MDREIFLRDIDDVIKCCNNKDEAGCLKELHHLIDYSPYLAEIHETILRDTATTWKQLLDIAKVLTIVHGYSADVYAKIEVTRIVSACYARAFILCPIKVRHVIAYNFYKFLDDTYFSYYREDLSCTEYCSHIGCYFYDLPLDDPDCKEIYSSDICDTPEGKAIFTHQRIAKLLQWFILCHVKSLNKTNPTILPIDLNEINSRIDECYNHLCNIDDSKLKQFAIQLMTCIIKDYSDEGLEIYFGGDNYRYQFNEDNKIEMHDEWKELEEESRLEYERQLESEDDSSYDDDIYHNDRYDEFGQYRGSYAQDVMGYSDDDIDTIFDGDPEAYWNID